MESILYKILAMILLMLFFPALVLLLLLLSSGWDFIQRHRRRRRMARLMGMLLFTPRDCTGASPGHPAITTKTELEAWHDTPPSRSDQKKKEPPSWLPTTPYPPGAHVRSNYTNAEDAWYDVFLGQIRLSIPTPRDAALRAWGQILVYTMTEEEQREFDRFLSQSLPPDQMPSDTQLWPWLKDLPREDAKYVLKYVKSAFRRRYKGWRILSLLADSDDDTSSSSPPPLAPSWRQAIAKVAPLQAVARGQIPPLDASRIAPRLLTVLRYHLVNCPLASESSDYKQLLAAHVLAAEENEERPPLVAALVAHVRQKEKGVVAWLRRWMQASGVTVDMLRRLAEEQGIWPPEPKTEIKTQKGKTWPAIPILTSQERSLPCHEGHARPASLNLWASDVFQVILEPSPEVEFDLQHAATRVHAKVAAQYGFDLQRGPLMILLLTLTTYPRGRQETYCVHIEPTSETMNLVDRAIASHHLVLTTPSPASRHLYIPREEVSQFWDYMHYYRHLQETWQRQGLWFTVGQTRPEWNTIITQVTELPPGKGAGALMGSPEAPHSVIVCHCDDIASWTHGHKWYLGIGGDVNLTRNPPTLRLDIAASVVGVGERNGQKACVTQLCVPLNERKAREWLHALGKPSNVMIVLAGENTHVACALGAQTKIAGKLAAIVNSVQKTANEKGDR